MDARWFPALALALSLACVESDDVEFRSDDLSDDQLGNQLSAGSAGLDSAGAEGDSNSEEDSAKELIDGGDAPFVAGCVGVYSDGNCQKISITIGDWCQTTTHVWEQTDDAVCSTWDSSADTIHDCDALCRAQQEKPGRCVSFPDTCAKYADSEPGSAQCECYDVDSRHSDIDGGSVPDKAGCHYQWDDKTCTTNRQLISGDACDPDDPLLLHEWALDACHMGGDAQVTIDCKKWCKKKGDGWTGRCEPDPKACEGAGSAICFCFPDV